MVPDGHSWGHAAPFYNPINSAPPFSAGYRKETTRKKTYVKNINLFWAASLDLIFEARQS